MNLKEMQPISLELIAGGDALAEVNDALTRIARDVIYRPNIDKDRAVAVKISIRPVCDDDGENRPEIRVEVGDKTPVHNANAMYGHVSVDGKTILIDPTRSTERDQMRLGNVADFQEARG